MKKLFFLILLLYVSAAFAQNTIFWSIRKEGNPHTSYLLGTYHQMGNSYVDSLKTVTRALQSSQLAIFENIDAGENLAKFLNSRTENLTYKEKLNKKHLENLEEIAADWAVPVSKLSPRELVFKLEQVYYEKNCGTVKPSDTSKVFDNYLIKIAKKNSVEVVGLESNELMTSYLNQADRTDWKDVKKDINNWLDNIKMKKETQSLCGMAEAYRKQKLHYQLDLPCAETVLISSRNTVWLPVIEEKIKTGKIFIAVGFAHLTGKCGLVTKLRESGYKVEPIYDLSR